MFYYYERIGMPDVRQRFASEAMAVVPATSTAGTSGSGASAAAGACHFGRCARRLRSGEIATVRPIDTISRHCHSGLLEVAADL